MKPMLAIFRDVCIPSRAAPVDSIKATDTNLGKAPLLILLLFVSASNALATTIVVVRTADALYIGADSKVQNVSVPRCKIIQSGDIFVSFAGTPIIPEARFSAIDIAIKASETTGDISDKVRAFDAVIRLKLTDAAEFVRRGDPESFTDWFGNNKNALSVVFVGFRGDVPVVYLRDFKVTTSSSQPVSISAMPINSEDRLLNGQARAFYIGQMDAINRLGGDANRISQQLGIAGKLRQLIELEIADVPKDVGRPISIIRITKDDASWIDRGACPDVQPQPKPSRSKPPIEASPVQAPQSNRMVVGIVIAITVAVGAYAAKRRFFS